MEENGNKWKKWKKMEINEEEENGNTKRKNQRQKLF